MTFLTTLLFFLIVLVPLIVIHELGHYLAARHVGVRVDQFSVGFPPRMFGRKWGETEYLISWIPLGGYVKLFGQNLDDEDPNDPRNYASKTVWQRLYILVAGPAANLITALIVMPIVFMWGIESPAHRSRPVVVATVDQGSLAERVGLQPGDRVVSIDGETVPNWNVLFRLIEPHAVAGEEMTFGVVRAEGETRLRIPASAFTGKERFGWHPLIEPVAGTVAPGTPAEAAGLEPGDRIVAVAGQPIARWDEISREIQIHGGKAIAFAIDRAGGPIVLEIRPRFHEDLNDGKGTWLIGISPPTVVERHGPVDAVILGTKRLGEITAGTFAFIGNLVAGNGSLDQVGGPVKIATFIEKAAGAGFASLALIVALISLQLGILNLLPIPALDGGHIAFFLAPELVKGAPLSPRLRAHIQTVGITLLLLLMVVVTYNDILDLL